MKAGKRLCKQATVCSSNASPGDFSGAETQLRSLNGLRGASVQNTFLFWSRLKSYSAQDSFSAVPAPREQQCEVFSVARWPRQKNENCQKPNNSIPVALFCTEVPVLRSLQVNFQACS